MCLFLKALFEFKFIDISSNKVKIQILMVPNVAGVSWWIMNFKTKLCIKNLLTTVRIGWVVSY